MTTVITGERGVDDLRAGPSIEAGAGAPPSHQPARRRRAGPIVLTATWAAAAASALAVWVLLHAVVLSGLQERGDQARAYAKLRQQLATGTAPAGGPIAAGAPVALLTARAAGWHHVVVVEGTRPGEVAKGPGHSPGTPLPGQAGTSVVMGRSFTHGAPFRHLRDLRAGDLLEVTTAQGTFSYRVEGRRAPGAPLPAPLPEGGARLTLVTSANRGWTRAWVPDHVLYVDAALVKGGAQPAASQPAARPPASSAPMSGDPSALVGLVLWLQGLAAAAALVAWSSVRWGRPPAVLAGAPVLVALLWAVTGAMELLLPNLY